MLFSAFSEKAAERTRRLRPCSVLLMQLCVL